MSIRLSTRILTAEDTPARRVFVDLAGGYWYALAGDGARVLDALLAGASRRAAAHHLAGLRGITPQRAAGDVDRLLLELQAANLVECA